MAIISKSTVLPTILNLASFLSHTDQGCTPDNTHPHLIRACYLLSTELRMELAARHYGADIMAPTLMLRAARGLLGACVIISSIARVYQW